MFFRSKVSQVKYIHTPFGHVSSIGFGCLQCVEPSVINESLKNGVNFFITAEAYGDANQKAIGQLLKNHPDTVIATKVGINFTGKNADEQFTQTRDQIQKSVKKCIALLEMNQLQLVGLHRLDDLHMAEDATGKSVPAWEVALDELICLQKLGHLNHIFLSEPTADQLTRAIEIAKAKNSAIVAIESAYSIVTRRAEVNGVKAICDREGITFLAYTSVIRGLTDKRLQQIKNTHFELSDAEFKKQVFAALQMTGDFIQENIDMFSCQNIKNNIRQMLKFQQCADHYNVTPTQLALAWVQYNKAIPIPGSRNPAHVRENNLSSTMIDKLVADGAFNELDKLFPAGTFHGDPNPITISGALDANNLALNKVCDSPAPRL